MAWKKGESGNPKGRPPIMYSLTDELRYVLNQKGPNGRTFKIEVAWALVKAAMDGDVKAMTYIFDRVDGRPSQQIVASGPGDNPITFSFNIDRAALGDGQDEDEPA